MAAEDYRGLLRPGAPAMASEQQVRHLELRESEEAFGVANHIHGQDGKDDSKEEEGTDDGQGTSPLAVTLTHPRGHQYRPDVAVAGMIASPPGLSARDHPPYPPRNAVDDPMVSYSSKPNNSPYAKFRPQLHEAFVDPASTLGPSQNPSLVVSPGKPRRHRRRQPPKQPTKPRHMSHHINEDLKDLIVVNTHHKYGREEMLDNSAGAGREGHPDTGELPQRPWTKIAEGG